MKIIHFHPDGTMASIFVGPLVGAELSAGHQTMLIVDRGQCQAYQICIPYDILTLFSVDRLCSFYKITRILRRFRPDIVVCHNSRSALVPLILAKITGVKSIIYFNHGIPFIAYSGIMKLLLKTIEFLNCRLATHVITVSMDMLNVLKPISEKKSPIMIANGSASGIDLQLFSAEIYRNSLWRASHGFEERDLLCVYIGRPHKRKGFDRAIALFADYIHNPKIKLIVCGAEEEDILKFYKKVPANILCLGHVSNINEILANCDVLICTSLHEGASYAVLEAMASSCLVISNDIPGVRNFIKNNISGFLIKDNSLDEFSRILSDLSLGHINSDLIKHAASIEVKKYSREDFILEYLSFLKREFV